VVAVLEVGDTLVPIFAFQAAEIGTGYETVFGCDFQLRLEGEGLVSAVVGCRYAAINEKQGKGTRPLGQAAFAAGCNDRPDGESALEAAALGDFLLDGLLRSLRDCK